MKEKIRWNINNENTINGNYNYNKWIVLLTLQTSNYGNESEEDEENMKNENRKKNWHFVGYNFSSISN